ncbi:MAG: 5-(carboxyamino)imidazole ribonucleotide mutase [Verrucomicrobiota bacterium]|nr:5-(carboxyamino)imidazole ribonucleotide mutase [Verrucomicrobiota bacterium]
MKQIAIVMGSKSDLPKLQPGLDILDSLGVEAEIRVMSAHRTPEEVKAFVEEAPKKGIKVFIAAAGMAAHLAGAIAAQTILPVIGIPVKGGMLDGLDALLSTVQMPGGIPVATVGLGSAGPKNAVLLAMQILAISNDSIAQKIKQFRREQADNVREADASIQ